MEDKPETSDPYLPETTEPSKIQIYILYFLNNEEKKEGNMPLNFSGEFNGLIAYEDIIDSFYSFLKDNPTDEILSDISPNEIIYEYIRYFDGEGWILLEENDIICLDEDLTFDNLQIMIKATILSEEKMEINKKYDHINKEINYIYNFMLKENQSDTSFDAPFNLIVLTANPLMNPDGKIELRTLNDFNMITSKIYNLLSKEYYLKYTEFCPLTKNVLKEVLTNEEKTPVILHLICKSTYIYKKTDNTNEESSTAFTNLIFEEDYNYKEQIYNYNSEYINKEILEKEIFNYEKNPKIKENVKKITLIISTPLAEDVYDIFKDFGFKNIIVQHTTLADINFVSDFNKTFYSDLIIHLSQPINKIYEIALNTYMDKVDPPTFCCCFHKHNIKQCNFAKNIENELYNNNFRKSNNESPENYLAELEKAIPHFFHLLLDCKCLTNLHDFILKEKKPDTKNLDNSFILHDNSHCVLCKKKKVKPITIGKKKYKNICCCNEAPEKHNINYIFQKDFTKEKNNNQIKFRRAEMIIEKKYIKYIPKYDKMELLVGKNKHILSVIKFFFTNERSLNIYGDNIDNMRQLGNIIQEYYLERYNYYESNKNESSTEKEPKLKRNKSSPNLIEDSNRNDNEIKTVNDDISLSTKKISPFVSKEIHFVEIVLNNDIKNIIKDDDKLNFNDIYFIYVYDINLLDRVKISNKKNKNKNKIIWFSEKTIQNKNIEKSIELTNEPELKSEKEYNRLDNIFLNEFIKFQHKQIVRNGWRK